MARTERDGPSCSQALKNGFSFGGLAIHEGPMALRPGLAAGFPFVEKLCLSFAVLKDVSIVRISWIMASSNGILLRQAVLRSVETEARQCSHTLK